MATPEKEQSKEGPPPECDPKERRKVVEEYIADLRAFLDKLRRKLNSGDIGSTLLISAILSRIRQTSARS